MNIFDRIANSLGLDNFDKRHKVGLSLLIVAMISITVLWVIELRRNIVEPLYAGLKTNQTNDTLSNNTNDEELKAKDTDSDGLNDFDELNLYKTSPYLADTDSDTFSDKKEIESGNNPTCPEGQVCNVSTTSQPTQQASDFNNPALENLLNQSTGVNTTNTITPTTPPATGTTSTLTTEEKAALKKTFGQNADPKSLRQLLLQTGMEKKTLDALSDEQIVAAFNEMIK